MTQSCQVTLDISGGPLIYNGPPRNTRVTLRGMIPSSWFPTIFLFQMITQFPSFPLMDLLLEMVTYVQDLAPSGHFSDLVQLATPEHIDSYETLLHRVANDLFRNLRCLFPDAEDELMPIPVSIQEGAEEAPNFMLLELILDTLKTLEFSTGQPVPYYKRAHTQVNIFYNVTRTITLLFDLLCLINVISTVYPSYHTGPAAMKIV